MNINVHVEHSFVFKHLSSKLNYDYLSTLRTSRTCEI